MGKHNYGKMMLKKYTVRFKQTKNMVSLFETFFLCRLYWSTYIHKSLIDILEQNTNTQWEYSKHNEYTHLLHFKSGQTHIFGAVYISFKIKRVVRIERNGAWCLFFHHDSCFLHWNSVLGKKNDVPWNTLAWVYVD